MVINSENLNRAKKKTSEAQKSDRGRDLIRLYLGGLRFSNFNTFLGAVSNAFDIFWGTVYDY